MARLSLQGWVYLVTLQQLARNQMMARTRLQGSLVSLLTLHSACQDPNNGGDSCRSSGSNRPQAGSALACQRTCATAKNQSIQLLSHQAFIRLPVHAAPSLHQAFNQSYKLPVRTAPSVASSIHHSCSSQSPAACLRRWAFGGSPGCAPAPWSRSSVA